MFKGPRYNRIGTEEMRGLALKLDKLGTEIARSLGQDSTYFDMLEQAAQPILTQIRINIVSRAKKSTGGLADAVGYRLGGRYGVATLSFGWQNIKVHHDGRKKPVSAATYGPILEFSDQRQLRHLYDAFDSKEDAANAILQSLLNGLVKQSI